MESLKKKKTVKHLRWGLSIYKTGRSPFWHARIYDSLTKRYVVRSTKETNRLTAADVAEEIPADLKAKRNTDHAVTKDRSFEHYARIYSDMKHVQSKGARQRDQDDVDFGVSSKSLPNPDFPLNCSSCDGILHTI